MLGLLKLENTTYFWVISYFVGLIFQECGSFIQRKCFKKNELLEKVFDNANRYDTLTKEESEGICQIVKNEMELEQSPGKELIYNYCKFHMNSAEKKGRADKDQALLAMSRSLCLYFAVGSVALFFLVGYKNIVALLCVFVMAGVSLLMYGRFVRFAKIRYVYILRSFYYSYLQKELQERKKSSEA